MTASKTRWWGRIAVVALAAGGVFLAWRLLAPARLPEAFAKGNGRIEAVEIDVATKASGRILDIRADEGDLVRAGQVRP